MSINPIPGNPDAKNVFVTGNAFGGTSGQVTYYVRFFVSFFLDISEDTAIKLTEYRLLRKFLCFNRRYQHTKKQRLMAWLEELR